jgi:4-aminobutyrate aminotransferase-like enzyme
VANTKKTLQLIRDFESRNVTFLEADGSWPIVWARAQGVHVWDADEEKYLDLTAAFGVAAAGHANQAVVRAGQKQMATLLHAMGDVHPHALKAELACKLSEITFERWSKALPKKAAASLPQPKIHAKTIFSNSGFEAVESALKTAMLATKKPGVITFAGAYHGLGYGVLNATHRDFFHQPFHSQLRRFGHSVSFPGKPADLAAIETQIKKLFRREKIGAILVEPIQARGGTNIPPRQFLPLLRKLCDQHGALLILDEIYTGFGRTGKWFACEHSRTMPDLLCLGKALTGGFPLSACVGRADVMDAAWPVSTGEAIHTSTFLGHPVGCAMALAQIAEIKKLKLCERSARLGDVLLSQLSAIKKLKLKIKTSSRGCGLMAAVELNLPDGKPATQIALDAIKTLLHQGYIFLPEGEHGNIISFTPPLTISRTQITQAVAALKHCLGAD